MNINFAWVNIRVNVEKDVTLQRILMLKVKTCSRHASTLKTKEIRRFSTTVNLPHHQWISFVSEDTLETIKPERVEQKSY